MNRKVLYLMLIFMLILCGCRKKQNNIQDSNQTSNDTASSIQIPEVAETKETEIELTPIVEQKDEENSEEKPSSVQSPSETEQVPAHSVDDQKQEQVNEPENIESDDGTIELPELPA